jgi:5-formyltetrahydrofolate cyclo-ligase
MSDLPGEAEKSNSAKVALRRRLLLTRRGLTPAQRAAAASQLQDQILAYVRREFPAVIAAYVPVGAEPGGTGLPDLLAAHARLLLPVLLPDNDLDWADYRDGLRPGQRGLYEPTGPPLGVDAIGTADLILVPALAVDPSGLRMGRGGGSYDRALSRLPAEGPLVLALLHDWELIPQVPAEPHDRSVHGVIRPTRGLTLNRGAEWTK